MQINPKTVKKQFEKNLSKYNKNALVQKELAQKLAAALIQYRTQFDRVLEAGCGTGFLTEELSREISFNKYFANDIVSKSKNYLDKILSDYTFITGNVDKIKTGSKVDLIISNAMFQWLNDLEKSFDNFYNMLEKDGILAFTTFAPDNFKEIRELCGLSLDYKSVEELRRVLEKKYEILYVEQYTKILNFNSPLEVLAHMKNTGVNSLASNWTFKDVKEFCGKYLQKYPDLTLTYRPIIVIAHKY